MLEFEFRILDFIQSIRTPLGDVVMPLISALGNAGMIWILLACILMALPRTRKSGVILAVALCWDVVLCNGTLKNLVARVRPYEVNTAVQLLINKPLEHSFPSGHTAVSFASVTALCLAGRRKLAGVMSVLAFAIAFSRLYLYVHYPTDILGGILVGIFAGYMGYCTVQRFARGKKIFTDKQGEL